MPTPLWTSSSAPPTWRWRPVTPPARSASRWRSRRRLSRGLGRRAVEWGAAVDLAVNGLVMRPWVMVVHATCARETPRSAAARLEGSGRARAGVGRIIRRFAACRCLLDRPHPGEYLLFGDCPLPARTSEEGDPPAGQVANR